jgi:hypothetical protein
MWSVSQRALDGRYVHEIPIQSSHPQAETNPADADAVRFWNPAQLGSGAMEGTKEGGELSSPRHVAQEKNGGRRSSV